jgi:putative tryptophan/tyrosine transport system substrate-binding protein
MRRRDFIALVGGAAVSTPFVARAQQPPIPVIGFLHSETPDAVHAYLVAFHRALSEAGFTEGQNVAIEYRWAEGQYDTLPKLVADLASRSVTVIVAGGGSAYAVKANGTSIPTVFTAGADPVRAGLVPSLSRPGGTMTGVAFFVVALGPKQLEMLLAAVPSAKQIGFLSNPTYANARTQIDELETAVRTVGRKLNIQGIVSEAEIGPAFAAFSQQGVDALIVSGDPSVFRWREQLVAQVARHALPACYGWREFAAAGGLMSYGADIVDAYHQVGVYTARILKGTKPADLPVVQPEKIELVLNLKTAKTLGLTFPLSLLGRADEVIE